MKNDKGFTLIELLAIFILLGIVANIAYSLTDNIKETARLGLIKTSAKKLFTIADNYYADREYKDFPTDGLSIGDMEIETTSFKDGKVRININGEYVLENVTDGTYCVNGSIKDLKIVKGTCLPVYISPVKDAIKAYLVITGLDGNLIKDKLLIPESYDINNPTQIMIIYIDENDKVIRISKGITSKDQDENNLVDIKSKLKTLCEADNNMECDLHYYISRINNISYVSMQNMCNLTGTNLCDGTKDASIVSSKLKINYTDMLKMTIYF